MSKKLHTLLLVDDEPANLQKLRRTFQNDYRVLTADSGESALQLLEEQAVSAIITDQRMPGLTGVDLLRRSLDIQPEVVRIILTGYTEVDYLMDAINEGHVHQYITKPWEPHALRQTVKQELRQLELERENDRLAEELKRVNQKLHNENVQLKQEVKLLTEEEGQLVYSSRAMGDLLNMLDRVVQTSSTVLIQGETGTGKELLARYIRDNSPRSDQALVPVNCGAVPADLMESAFFGHRKGSFTGATEDAKGFFELANGGTLFLDEIGEASLELQVKLLRVLQDGQIMPVGGQKPKTIDVRIIASTNRDLSGMVETGVFRQDLFFRLNVFTVNVPPLRARIDDVEVLAQFFLGRFERRLNKPIPGFEEQTLEFLKSYPWPGNVRELENEVERIVILSEPNRSIPPENLSKRIRSYDPAGAGSGSLKEQLASLEKRLILDALEQHGQNKSQTARSLGITRQTIIAKLKQYDSSLNL